MNSMLTRIKKSIIKTQLNEDKDLKLFNAINERLLNEIQKCINKSIKHVLESNYISREENDKREN